MYYFGLGNPKTHNNKLFFYITVCGVVKAFVHGDLSPVLHTTDKFRYNVYKIKSLHDCMKKD